MNRGIDVSKWNGAINWETVAASGIRFAMVRAGVGAAKGGFSLDPRFSTNVNGAHQAGIKVGVYCYSYARSVSAAVVEAEKLVEVLSAYKDKITYPVAYDIEEDAQAQLGKSICTAMCNAFCDVVRRAGLTPMVYCSLSWLENNLIASALTADVWVAAWRNSGNDTIKQPHTMWQYTDSGAVPGIKGNVDLDYGYVDYGDTGEVPTDEELPGVETPDEADTWAQGAWTAAFAKGILDGTRPRDPVRREEIAVILQRVGLI